MARQGKLDVRFGGLRLPRLKLMFPVLTIHSAHPHFSCEG